MRFGSFFQKADRFVTGALYYTLSIAPVVIAVQTGFASMAYVEGRSMAPTLNNHLEKGLSRRDRDADRDASTLSIATIESGSKDNSASLGNIVLVRKFRYMPERGDVVVLDYPGHPGEQIVKRLIAKEGDVVMALVPKRHKTFDDVRRDVQFKHAVSNSSDVIDLIEDLITLEKEGQPNRVRIPMMSVAATSNEGTIFDGRDDDSFASRRVLMSSYGRNGQNDQLHNGHNDGHHDNNGRVGRDDIIFVRADERTEIIGKVDTTSAGNADTMGQTMLTKNTSNVWFQDVQPTLLRIPKGYCWVEGDNSALSRDSRDFGPVPLGMICGTVVSVMWPPTHMGLLRRRRPSAARVIYQHNEEQ